MLICIFVIDFVIRYNGMLCFLLLFVCYACLCFFFCVSGRSCGNLLPPTNGEIASFSCNDYAGSVATVACKPGYSINGAKMRTCMSNGQWSGVSTKCTREYTI